MPPMPCGYVKEHWLWEANEQCPSVELSQGRQEVYFHTDPVLESCGTAGVRGDTGERKHPNIVHRYQPIHLVQDVLTMQGWNQRPCTIMARPW